MLRYALMDISVFKAVISELARRLPGKRLAEIAEGQSGEFYLLFKGEGGKITLLVSPRPQSPRIHFLSGKPKDLRELTPFGQSLANLLLGSRLLSIEQEGLERAALFNFSRKTGKDEAPVTLIFEMAGKKPELIVLDAERKILLAQSYVALEEGSRVILPGLFYSPPPVPDKQDPYNVTAGDIKDIIRENPEMPQGKALFNKIGGLSPLLAREVAAAGNSDPEKLAEALKNLIHELGAEKFAPRIYETEKGPVLAAGPLSQFGDAPISREFSSVNEAADAFYGAAETRRAFWSAKTGLLRKLNGELSSARKKVQAIESDLARAQKAEQYQLFAQTLMASLNQVPVRADQVSLTDYASGNTVEIFLDPKRSAVENAQEYFKKAKKARAALKLLQERHIAVRAELETLEARLEDLEMTAEMDGLRPYLPEPKGGKIKAAKNTLPEFPSFMTSDGYLVLIGKNSKMNDLLTFKAAQSMDLWLHAQGYRGSHVIVRNPARRPDIPLSTILQAAEAAAYYSEAKKESSAPVDYTFVKYVRKMKDGAPGAVIFTGNKTVFVEPKKK